MPAITAKTAEYYIEILEQEGDTDEKLQEILERDQIRKLNNFQLIEKVLHQKYEMTYEEFVQREVVKKLNYSFEAEQGLMDWEIAIDGIETMRGKLDELRS